ncbi:Copper chaperone for superoxide dismutase-like [Oopsacas minuta]|uniref:Copper chaperone for superoxide dismutase-like n=1 Tax=Oopsacas minuta TaxID=111878 RepID=A0AAV7JN97_9METZ|nr:Copper chaperone for superoxide dismutase-like [Oopsacas minuta]
MAETTSHLESDETIMEFAVRMQSPADELLVRNALDQMECVRNVIIDIKEESVMITSTLSSFKVQQILEATGLLVVLRGYNYATNKLPVESSVVAMLCNSKVCGLTRLIQGDSTCLIEGSLTELKEGTHKVEVHISGDISNGSDSCGPVYGTDSNDPKGYLGTFEVGTDGVANFRLTTNQFRVCDVIGRSVVTSPIGSGECTYGIIARSSGVLGNRKKVCQCSGDTIWEEATQVKQENIRSCL